MVHGRFQPFHNGHLELLRHASSRFPAVVVGITNADRASRVEEAVDPVRSTPEANPFSFGRRALMVRAVLRAEGLDDAPIVPFPISQPELWPDYVLPGTVHVLRVFDAWGEEKARRLRAHGQEVVVVDPGAAKEVSGAEVRRRLREGGDWQALVPAPVADLLQQLA